MSTEYDSPSNAADAFLAAAGARPTVPPGDFMARVLQYALAI